VIALYMRTKASNCGCQNPTTNNRPL